jgi:hypothetical protein
LKLRKTAIRLAHVNPLFEEKWQNVQEDLDDGKPLRIPGICSEQTTVSEPICLSIRWPKSF